MSHVKRPLLPLSALYGAAVVVRNWLFDAGVLKSRQFPLPVICVGNITVGGTGKTPHTEFLIAMLRRMGHRVAVLSRGYGRRTHGYRVADGSTTAAAIGDEPLQMHRKFPDITVAVCEDRPHGIERLLERQDRPTAIILDDAFQHRYVQARLNMVLMDYSRPVYEDALLPAGRLREPVSALERAHIVVVTKCPKTITPIDCRVVQQKLKLRPWQRLFFTRMVYGPPYSLFADDEGRHATMPLNSLRTHEHVMLLSGIARPEHLWQDMAAYCTRTTPLAFPDHHTFTAHDVERINSTFASLAADDKLVLTTEKDAARLTSITGLSTEVRRALYVLPISVEFLRGEQATFEQAVIDSLSEQIH